MLYVCTYTLRRCKRRMARALRAGTIDDLQICGGLNRDPDVIPLGLGPKRRVHFVPCDCSLKFPFSVNPNRLPNTHLLLLRQRRDTLIIAVIVIILHMLLNPVQLIHMLPRHGQSSGHHIIIISCSRLKLRLSRTFGGSKS